ncbi:hypothetical protein [Micromonospora maris]|uniref:hypothetical protein n=1 Tax=Micromonospora maris TaxID=1003110 RepID=UPI000206B8A5|nr:hypothetical protein [Micromonospora maris]AEB43674.1 hypothetical protein VAB18032_12800 [Micromonospora maris AB-18-032]
MVRIAVCTCALLLALAGCAGDHSRPLTTETSTVRGPASPTSAGGSLLTGEGFQTLVAATEVHFLAALRGELRVGSGGCLVLRDAEMQSYVVVWPPGVTLLTDGRIGVRVPKVGALTAGDRISAGGGYEELPTVAQPSDLYPLVPPECNDVAAIALVGSVGKSA